MAFTVIDTAEIAVGQPTSNDVFTKIKDNFDDHETRISGLETTISAYRPIQFEVSGNFYLFGAPQALVTEERIPFDMTLLGARLILMDAGTAGNLEVDLLFKRGAGAFGSVFSSKPILAHTDPVRSVSSGVLSVTSLLAGDFLALSISQVMTNCNKFMVEVDWKI